jgi:hypothetical protein
MPFMIFLGCRHIADRGGPREDSNRLSFSGIDVVFGYPAVIKYHVKTDVEV